MTKKQDVLDDVNPMFADDDFSVTNEPFDTPIEEQAEGPAETTEEPEAVKEELSEEQKAEYLKIVDTIMFEGSYSEVRKFGGKYSVTFRSRSAGEDNEITKRLDAMTFNTMISYQNQSSLLTLAYCLIDFNGTDLSGMDMKARYDYVTKLPSQVVIVIANLMSEFDSKIMAAMEYGRENF